MTSFNSRNGESNNDECGGESDREFGRQPRNTNLGFLNRRTASNPKNGSQYGLIQDLFRAAKNKVSAFLVSYRNNRNKKGSNVRLSDMKMLPYYDGLNLGFVELSVQEILSAVKISVRNAVSTQALLFSHWNHEKNREECIILWKEEMDHKVRTANVTSEDIDLWRMECMADMAECRNQIAVCPQGKKVFYEERMKKQIRGLRMLLLNALEQMVCAPSVEEKKLLWESARFTIVALNVQRDTILANIVDLCEQIPDVNSHDRKAALEDKLKLETESLTMFTNNICEQVLLASHEELKAFEADLMSALNSIQSTVPHFQEKSAHFEDIKVLVEHAMWTLDKVGLCFNPDDMRRRYRSMNYYHNELTPIPFCMTPNDAVLLREEAMAEMATLRQGVDVHGIAFSVTINRVDKLVRARASLRRLHTLLDLIQKQMSFATPDKERSLFEHEVRLTTIALNVQREMVIDSIVELSEKIAADTLGEEGMGVRERKELEDRVTMEAECLKVLVAHTQTQIEAVTSWDELETLRSDTELALWALEAVSLAATEKEKALWFEDAGARVAQSDSRLQSALAHHPSLRSGKALTEGVSDKGDDQESSGGNRMTTEHPKGSNKSSTSGAPEHAAWSRVCKLSVLNQQLSTPSGIALLRKEITSSIQECRRAAAGGSTELEGSMRADLRRLQRLPSLIRKQIDFATSAKRKWLLEHEMKLSVIAFEAQRDLVVASILKLCKQASNATMGRERRKALEERLKLETEALKAIVTDIRESICIQEEWAGATRDIQDQAEATRDFLGDLRLVASALDTVIATSRNRNRALHFQDTKKLVTRVFLGAAAVCQNHDVGRNKFWQGHQAMTQVAEIRAHAATSQVDKLHCGDVMKSCLDFHRVAILNNLVHEDSEGARVAVVALKTQRDMIIANIIDFSEQIVATSLSQKRKLLDTQVELEVKGLEVVVANICEQFFIADSHEEIKIFEDDLNLVMKALEDIIANSNDKTKALYFKDVKEQVSEAITALKVLAHYVNIKGIKERFAP